MKKIHNDKSRSEYFTFTPLSHGNRKGKGPANSNSIQTSSAHVEPVSTGVEI